MEIDYQKIATLYDKGVLNAVIERKDTVIANIDYLNGLGINSNEIFERYTPIFIKDTATFINSVEMLIKRLGDDYIAILEENIEYWGELL